MIFIILYVINAFALTGFYFDQLREDEVGKVSASWKFARGDDVMLMRIKVTRLPHLCLRETTTHEAVCWEVLETVAYMNHIYTVPEYRRKGNN